MVDNVKLVDNSELAQLFNSTSTKLFKQSYKYQEVI